VRFALGIEAAEDIIADITQALSVSSHDSQVERSSR
jgi:cystathionine beta-lyase/cystathionine gamma-synthase